MISYTVIGAAGFVGVRLTAALRARGFDVYAPTRGDPELLERDLGRVFYCAGLTGDFMARPFDTVDAHVGVLTQLLRASRFERLIYLSSTRLYDSLGARGGRENDILEFDVSAQRNVYDLSKALGENLCLARSGGRAAVARLSNLFDTTDDAGGFLSDILKRARRERVITLASSPQSGRDYIHVEDVIKGLIAMDAQDVEGVVNIASGSTLTNEAMARLFDEAGWRVELTGTDGASHGPTCDTTRLRALGIQVRDVQTIIRDALSDPSFFRG